jgi:hypothetical protein
MDHYCCTEMSSKFDTLLLGCIIRGMCPQNMYHGFQSNKLGRFYPKCPEQAGSAVDYEFSIDSLVEQISFLISCRRYSYSFGRLYSSCSDDRVWLRCFSLSLISHQGQSTLIPNPQSPSSGSATTTHHVHTFTTSSFQHILNMHSIL